jgi:hypothetical protein
MTDRRITGGKLDWPNESPHPGRLLCRQLATERRCTLSVAGAFGAVQFDMQES